MNGKWWDRNWEILNGCSEISEACVNCFAKGYIRRFEKRQKRWQGLLTSDKKHWNGAVNLCPENLDIPLRVKKPTVWFVAERGDLFHEKVTDEFIFRVIATLPKTPQHTFILLTKRAKRMALFMKEWVEIAFTTTLKCAVPEEHPAHSLRRDILDHFSTPYLYKNLFSHVYFGITAENQKRLEERLPYLLQIPGKKIISVEPMLGPVDLSKYLPIKNEDGTITFHAEKTLIPERDGIICGGESGPGARATYGEWARDLKDQCASAHVPFFFKSWGSHRLHKGEGRLLDGQEYNELPW